MKRVVYLLVVGLLVGSSNAVRAQIINQDAEGKSAIVVPGGTIGVDIQAATIKANYAGLLGKEREWLLGVDLQGKNKSGVANLFDKQEFLPESRLSGLVGRRMALLSTDDSPLLPTKPAVVTAQAGLAAKQTTAVAQYKALVTAEFEGAGVCPEGVTAYVDLLRGLPDKGDFEKIEQRIMSAFLNAPGAPALTPDCRDLARKAVQRVVDQVKTEPAIKDYLADFKLVTDDFARRRVDLEKDPPKSVRTIWYLRGGVNVTGYTHDLGDAFTTVKSRFRDTLVVEPFGEIGLSSRIRGRHLLGGAIGFQKQSNFPDSLEKRVYRYATSSTTAIPGGTLQTTQDITAYYGNLERTVRPYLKLDYVYLTKLPGANYMALNAYTRYYTNTDDTQVLGGGIYFVDGKGGKFLGGTYVQTNDLWGNKESEFRQTVAFGLIAKFAFGNLFL